MRDSTPKTLCLRAFVVVLALAPAFAHAGAGDSQLDALAAAQATNKTGSDKDLQASTTNAMRALMELGHANIPGALSNGYKAFGQYRNSGNLDGLRLQNAITALKMDSIGNYLASNPRNNVFMAPLSEYDTTYRRLDPAFLRQGEAGQVAAEFEKATGMSRDTFLKKMAAASDSTIKVSDPQLVDKVLSRFQDFVKEIPNNDFRKNVEAQIAKVPQTARTGIISQALQKATEMFAGSAPAGKSDIAVAQQDASRALASSGSSGAAGAATAPTPAASTAVTGEKPIDERQLAAQAGAAQNLNGRPEYRGIDFEKIEGGDAVGNVLQTAMDEQGTEDTIFKQISRKYRSLSAMLTQKPL